MKKGIVIIIASMIIIVSILAGLTVMNSPSDDDYYALCGMGSTESNYTSDFIISEPPVLNKETTITWRSYHKITGNTSIANESILNQLILPESIILTNGSIRNIRGPGDELYYSWTLKPIETGTYYTKFGYCYYANESLIQNESLNYHEVGLGHGNYYSLYVLCLDVGENSGQILTPNNVVNTTYTVSGNFNYSSDESSYPLYSFNDGDLCWLNVTVDSFLDIPNCDADFDVWVSSSPFEYLLPKSEKVNITEGINYFNYSFYIHNIIPEEYQGDDIKVQFEIDALCGWPVIINPDGDNFPAGYNTRIAFNIRIIDE